MHTVSWVADQLGLAPGTLRAWEQRYGVVHPVRSEGGFRLYSDDDMSALRAMVKLIDGGMQPAQAADRVRSGAVQAPLADVHRAGPPAALPDPATLIAATRAYDGRALDDLLDAAFAAAGFEYVVDTWLLSALKSVGQAWEGGSLDIAQEHFISAGVMRRLAAAFDAAGNARAGRHVICGLAPGADHEIAVLAFATMLRRRGLRVTYLGPDLPVPSWVKAATEARPDAVVIGAPRPVDALGATQVGLALLEAMPTLMICSGGAGAPGEHRLPGATLAEAADWLADALATPAGRGASAKG